jgi:hypothetical protein
MQEVRRDGGPIPITQTDFAIGVGTKYQVKQTATELIISIATAHERGSCQQPVSRLGENAPAVEVGGDGIK